MKYKVWTPINMHELWEALNREDARIIAGGTDLLVQLRAGVKSYKHLIDITRIPDFAAFSEEDDNISIGSTITHNALLGKNMPAIFYDVFSSIGSPQIRNMGTIGGNICNASPAGDAILPLYLYNATVILLSEKKKREVSIFDFIKGPGKTDLKNKEVLYKIKIPQKYKDYKYIFKKVGKRTAMTISIVSMGLILKSDNGIIKDIKIAYGAVAPTVIRLKKVEEFLKSKTISEYTLKEAKQIVMDEISPIDDIRATAEYRKEVAGNLMFLLKDNI